MSINSRVVGGVFDTVVDSLKQQGWLGDYGRAGDGSCNELDIGRGISMSVVQWENACNVTSESRDIDPAAGSLP